MRCVFFFFLSGCPSTDVGDGREGDGRESERDDEEDERESMCV